MGKPADTEEMLRRGPHTTAATAATAAPEEPEEPDLPEGLSGLISELSYHHIHHKFGNCYWRQRRQRRFRRIRRRKRIRRHKRNRRNHGSGRFCQHISILWRGVVGNNNGVIQLSSSQSAVRAPEATEARERTAPRELANFAGIAEAPAALREFFTLEGSRASNILTITDSYHTTGTVSGTAGAGGNAGAGGAVGAGTLPGAAGTAIIGANIYAGGVTGFNSGEFLTNDYSIGDVSGTSGAGGAGASGSIGGAGGAGVVGSNGLAGGIAYVGGLVGYHITDIISSYSYGNITANAEPEGWG